jgi:DNA-binding transcriptional regulator YiaG
MDQDINVRSLRAALGLTQEQLGKAVGVDQSTVSNWENGASPSGPARKLLQSLSANVASAADNGAAA